MLIGLLLLLLVVGRLEMRVDCFAGDSRVGGNLLAGDVAYQTRLLLHLALLALVLLGSIRMFFMLLVL